MTMMMRTTTTIVRGLERLLTPPRPVAPKRRRYVELAPSDLEESEPLLITDEAFNKIVATIGAMPAEQGGMLGGPRKAGVVSHFAFDKGAGRTSATYTPDVGTMNALLGEQWNPAGVDLLGFVHSHPSSLWRPSGGDAVYAERILAAIGAMDRLLLPIVQTEPDTGRFGLYGHIAQRARRGVRVDEVPVRVVPATTFAPTLTDRAFGRVREAYDLDLMYRTRLVLVGVGGAAAFAESMARAGVGEFVLIDPDIVELANVGTQQVYRSDVGRSKVDAVARRVLDVNPHARVVGVRAELDELTDEMMRRLIHRPLPNTATAGPAATVLCGLTDNFWAQARVNRLALQFGVPMMAAQVYREGRGVEVSFSVPGVTPACGRCVLGNRYRAHLRGFQNDVTSHGTPLWATERLNALKAEVLMAILHGSTARTDGNHPATLRYGTLLQRIADRNLIVGRLDPDISDSLGLKMFDAEFSGSHPRVVTDETLWLQQAPENAETGFEPCGDCGGTGDLSQCEGTFSDTRLPTVAPSDKGRQRGRRSA